MIYIRLRHPDGAVTTLNRFTGRWAEVTAAPRERQGMLRRDLEADIEAMVSYWKWYFRDRWPDRKYEVFTDEQ